MIDITVLGIWLLAAYLFCFASVFVKGTVWQILLALVGFAAGFALFADISMESWVITLDPSPLKTITLDTEDIAGLGLLFVIGPLVFFLRAVFD